jgi:hypothetical protein
MSKLSVTCHDFTSYRRNTLFGFATIKISELQLEIRDIAIHQKGESRWAQLPAKPQVKDGALVKNGDGKIQYWPIMDFTSRAVRDAFSHAVIDALLETFPNAFADRETAA